MEEERFLASEQKSKMSKFNKLIDEPIVAADSSNSVDDHRRQVYGSRWLASAMASWPTSTKQSSTGCELPPGTGSSPSAQVWEHNDNNNKHAHNDTQTAANKSAHQQKPLRATNVMLISCMKLVSILLLAFAYNRLLVYQLDERLSAGLREIRRQQIQYNAINELVVPIIRHSLHQKALQIQQQQVADDARVTSGGSSKTLIRGKARAKLSDNATATPIELADVVDRLTTMLTTATLTGSSNNKTTVNKVRVRRQAPKGSSSYAKKRAIDAENDTGLGSDTDSDESIDSAANDINSDAENDAEDRDLDQLVEDDDQDVVDDPSLDSLIALFGAGADIGADDKVDSSGTQNRPEHNGRRLKSTGATGSGRGDNWLLDYLAGGASSLSAESQAETTVVDGSATTTSPVATHSKQSSEGFEIERNSPYTYQTTTTTTAAPASKSQTRPNYSIRQQCLCPPGELSGCRSKSE